MKSASLSESLSVIMTGGYPCVIGLCIKLELARFGSALLFLSVITACRCCREIARYQFDRYPRLRPGL
ncbi:hypothetical protein PILCRDRAFT_822761 [Piloderma croceum F 1598]|uniref:Uncharacterized protein n=1 Tax=Piloderma croceum (strain F 1598) TaxID=765440 RepID=A0A0C3F6I0_PILCF|nr:hypothetical protein PILCRDRAFT_822761 [Piloderma croceum F 1598]